MRAKRGPRAAEGEEAEARGWAESSRRGDASHAARDADGGAPGSKRERARGARVCRAVGAPRSVDLCAFAQA